ncbi:MAG: TatD family hydrolase [Acidimicrobiia bacterium]
MSVPASGWFDSHCHLESLDDPVDDVLTRAREAGVTGVVSVGTDLETSRRTLDLADPKRGVWATAGLHPHEASKLSAEAEMLETLLHAPEVVAVGEAGLDYHYEHSPRSEQEVAFRWQIHLAKRFRKALVIHSREAWDDTFRILDDEGVPDRTVFHCFTGGPAEARAALDRGASLSFSGVVTFKNAGDVRAAAALTPHDRMLVETDAPYLAPVPVRGRTNEPAYVPHVGAVLAEVAGRSIDEVADSTREAAATVFGLSAASESTDSW